MVNSSAGGLLGKLGGYVLVGIIAYGIFKVISNNKNEVNEAEDTTYEVDGHKINDYGSLQNPVSMKDGTDGQAVGQFGDSKGYGAEISMITPGIGQNFHGRAFGY